MRPTIRPPSRRVARPIARVSSGHSLTTSRAASGPWPAQFFGGAERTCLCVKSARPPGCMRTTWRGGRRPRSERYSLGAPGRPRGPGGRVLSHVRRSYWRTSQRHPRGRRHEARPARHISTSSSLRLGGVCPSRSHGRSGPMSRRCAASPPRRELSRESCGV